MKYETIKKLIQENRIEKAFTLLLNDDNIKQDKYFYNKIVLLKNQHKRHIEEINSGYEAKYNEINRIIGSLLTLIDDLPETNDKTNEYKNNSNLIENEKKELNELIYEWRQSLSVAETPSQRKKCKLEIERLSKILDSLK